MLGLDLETFTIKFNPVIKRAFKYTVTDWGNVCRVVKQTRG